MGSQQTVSNPLVLPIVMKAAMHIRIVQRFYRKQQRYRLTPSGAAVNKAATLLILIYILFTKVP